MKGYLMYTHTHKQREMRDSVTPHFITLRSSLKLLIQQNQPAQNTKWGLAEALLGLWNCTDPLYLYHYCLLPIASTFYLRWISKTLKAWTCRKLMVLPRRGERPYLSPLSNLPQKTFLNGVKTFSKRRPGALNPLRKMHIQVIVCGPFQSGHSLLKFILEL